jgi:uncharacterized protein
MHSLPRAASPTEGILNVTAPDLPAGDVSARISRLFVYPVKSCGGIELTEATLTETGLEFDRAWMVVDENGRFVTQRQYPRMALITPRLRQYDMVLRAPGMLALHVQLDTVEEPVRVTVWRDDVAAYDMGDVAAQWFSDFLGAKLRLVRFDPEHQRLSSKEWTQGVAAPNQFSDGYAVLVVSQPALDALNNRLHERGEPPVGMERFRPNVVIDSAPAPAEALQPHAEDHLHDLRVVTQQGIATLRVVKPCARCEIPNIDPQSAESGAEPGATLALYRSDTRLDGAVTFGMNAIVIGGVDHVLQVGQPVGADIHFE